MGFRGWDEGLTNKIRTGPRIHPGGGGNVAAARARAGTRARTRR